MERPPDSKPDRKYSGDLSIKKWSHLKSKMAAKSWKSVLNFFLEPKVRLIRNLVVSIEMTCRSKEAQIFPITNPRCPPWPPCWKSILNFSWTKRPADSKLDTFKDMETILQRTAKWVPPRAGKRHIHGQWVPGQGKDTSTDSENDTSPAGKWTPALAGKWTHPRVVKWTSPRPRKWIILREVKWTPSRSCK